MAVTLARIGAFCARRRWLVLGAWLVVLALAVSTEKRIPNFPDIPTFREVGQDLVAATWFSLSGPARLPSEKSAFTY